MNFRALNLNFLIFQKSLFLTSAWERMVLSIERRASRRAAEFISSEKNENFIFLNYFNSLKSFPIKSLFLFAILVLEKKRKIEPTTWCKMNLEMTSEQNCQMKWKPTFYQIGK